MLVCWFLGCVLTTHPINLGPRMVSFGSYEFFHVGAQYRVGDRLDVIAFAGGFE